MTEQRLHGLDFLRALMMMLGIVLHGAQRYQKYHLGGMLRNRVDRILFPFLVFLPPVALMLSLMCIAASNLQATGSIGFDLAHQPFLTLFGMGHYGWDVGAVPKFLAVTLATTACCLLSYQYLVRGKVIGRLLGERKP